MKESYYFKFKDRIAHGNAKPVDQKILEKYKILEGVSVYVDDNKLPKGWLRVPERGKNTKTLFWMVKINGKTYGDIHHFSTEHLTEKEIFEMLADVSRRTITEVLKSFGDTIEDCVCCKALK